MYMMIMYLNMMNGAVAYEYDEHACAVVYEYDEWCCSCHPLVRMTWLLVKGDMKTASHMHGAV
jgi:hypothetical protein